jgi:hypothetical protein
VGPKSDRQEGKLPSRSTASQARGINLKIVLNLQPGPKLFTDRNGRSHSAQVGGTKVSPAPKEFSPQFAVHFSPSEHNQHQARNRPVEKPITGEDKASRRKISCRFPEFSSII